MTPGYTLSGLLDIFVELILDRLALIVVCCRLVCCDFGVSKTEFVAMMMSRDGFWIVGGVELAIAKFVAGQYELDRVRLMKQWLRTSLIRTVVSDGDYRSCSRVGLCCRLSCSVSDFVVSFVRWLRDRSGCLCGRRMF